MNTKPRIVLNAPDFKDMNGQWAISSRPETGLECRTRAGCLWRNMSNRCLPDGAYQRKNPTYIGITNDFESFQDFAEWCQQEYGYLRLDGDRFWSLDKDILAPNYKSYSKETCLFVPRRVNSLLVSSKGRKGNYPLGVCFYKPFNKYKAAGKGLNNSYIHLGYFTTPMEAHRAWQEYKIERILSFCENDEEIKNHTKLVKALLKLSDTLTDHMKLGVETEWEKI